LTAAATATASYTCGIQATATPTATAAAISVTSATVSVFGQATLPIAVPFCAIASRCQKQQCACRASSQASGAAVHSTTAAAAAAAFVCSGISAAATSNGENCLIILDNKIAAHSGATTSFITCVSTTATACGSYLNQPRPSSGGSRPRASIRACHRDIWRALRLRQKLHTGCEQEEKPPEQPLVSLLEHVFRVLERGKFFH
jgi:hypothetical protein